MYQQMLEYCVVATTESVLEHFRIFGHVRVTPISAKQKQEMDDPYR